MKNILALLCCAVALFTCKSAQNLSQNTEPHRPLFHFTPPAHWMNDPNGMVFFAGEWHLFYQYFPDSTVWGPMHWGHAVSRDLVHWEHLPIALFPDSLGLIFSGSVVVDWQNTSGFGQNGQPPLVAIFTQHDIAGERAGRTDFQYQSLAFSNDRGRTWTKYAGNPVIPNAQKIKDFRDPKVIWHDQSKQWILVLAAHDHAKIWTSPDLKSWTHQSDFGREYGTHAGVWECPDFFPMPVENSSEQKWVLLQSFNPGNPNGGSGTQYFVGDFDGKKFTLDPEFAKNCTDGRARFLDFGRDNYAGVTWSDVPKTDGRRIFLGWMSNWDYATVVPTQKWRSAMTLPRQLILKKTLAGFRIFQQPAAECEKLRNTSYVFENQEITGSLDLSRKLGFLPTCSEMVLQFDIPIGQNPAFGVRLSNALGEQYVVGFDASKNQFFSDRTHAGKTTFSEKFATTQHFAARFSSDHTIEMHVIFDRASCELFADGGSIAMTELFFPNQDFSKMEIFSAQGAVKVKSGKIWKLLYPTGKTAFIPQDKGK